METEEEEMMETNNEIDWSQDILPVLGIQHIPKRNRTCHGNIGRWVNAIPQLILTNNTAKLERLVTVLRHVEETDTIRWKDGRCPGVVYMLDVFQDCFVHDLFLKLDTARFTWENIIAHLDGGEPLFSSTNLTERELSALEQFLFTITYIACFFHGECNASAVQQLFRDVLEKISQKRLKIMSSSKLPPNTWYDAFTKRNLRFYNLQGAKPGSSNLYLIEILEAIRLRTLLEQGLVRADAHNQNNSAPDVQQLGRTLSCSFYTVLEFANLSDFVAIENLKILAQFAAQLPKSWFTAEFLSSCLKIVGELDIADGEYAQQGILAVVTLVSFWMRKTDTAASVDLASRMISFVQKVVTQMRGKPDYPPELHLYSLLALCASVGKLSVEMDLNTVELICSGLEVIPNLSIPHQDVLFSALAQLMKTIPPALLSAITSALLSAWDTKPAQERTSSLPLETAIKLMYLHQVVAKSRLDAENGKNKSARKSWWPFARSSKAADTTPAWLQAFIDSALTLVNADSMHASTVASLMVQVGIWRSISQSIGEASSKGLKPSDHLVSSRKMLESTILEALVALPRRYNNVDGEPVQVFQEAVAYATAQVLGSPTPPAIEEMELDWQPTLSTLLAVLLSDTNTLKLPDNFLAELSDNAITSLETASTNPLYLQLKAKVSKQSQHPLYSELGRMSRAIGLIISYQWTKGRYQDVTNAFERICAFTKGVYLEWERCALNQQKYDNKPTTKQTMDSLWQYFKTILFVVTVISHRFSDALLEHELLTFSDDEARAIYMRCATEGVRNVFHAFSDLHFITSRFGLGGFKTWQETLQGLVLWLHERETETEAKKREQEGARGITEDILCSITPEYCRVYVHPNAVTKTGLLFYLMLSRLVLRHLSESYVADELLPRAYPYLTFHTPPSTTQYIPIVEDNDLFEVSHALCMTLFEHKDRFRGLVKQFAGWYAGVVVEHFPAPIDLDLLRRSFAFLIKSLSTFSSAHRATVVLGSDTDGDEDDEDSAAERTARNRGGIREEVEVEDVGEQEPKYAAEEEHDEDSDSAEPTSETALQDEEGEILAWSCIVQLMDRIDRLSHKIESLGGLEARISSPPANNLATTSGASTRLKAILSASPATELTMQRDELAMVLFDQVRTIGLRGLESLLATIRQLLIVGRLPPFLQVEEANDDNTVQQAENIQSTKISIRGIGIQTNPDASPLWKALFDAVGHSRGFDYTRRERCVQWYLELVREARDMWETKRRELKVERDSLDESEKRRNPVPLPKDHPLRAKL